MIQNKTNFIIGLLIVLAALGYYYVHTHKEEPQVACTMEAKLCPDGSYVGRNGPKCEFAACPAAPVVGYKNTSYSIAGMNVTLKDGKAEEEAAPGSASKIVTQYFGNEAKGDLNGDGTEDVAFILTQSTGGSGTFYYVVAATMTEAGYSGTNAILLGDRIAPQTTEIHNGQIVVNYADRKPTDSMIATPSIGVTKRLKIEGGALVEVK